MRINDFVKKSIGTWRTMRSSHSLAFQKFEEIQGEVVISNLDYEDKRVLDLLIYFNMEKTNYDSPFIIEWKSETEWVDTDDNGKFSGKSILIPIPKTENTGLLLRSMGYLEKVKAISNYNFLSDGTFKLRTNYEASIAEEKIWFVSENVRSRASVLLTSNGSGVLQTSFSSEIRRLTA